MQGKIEFWRLQKEAALSNQECADYLEVTKRSIERWRSGQQKAPHAVILAIQALNNGVYQKKNKG